MPTNADCESACLPVGEPKHAIDISYYLHVMPEVEQSPSSQALCFVAAVMPSWNALCSDKFSSMVQPVSMSKFPPTEVAKRAIDLHFAEGLLFISFLHNGYACSMMRADDDKGLTFGIALTPV